MPPCKSCLSRREFLAGAAAVTLTACGDGIIGGPSGSEIPPGGPITIVVGDFPGLAAIGTPVVVGELRAAMRTGSATFSAVSMICTHEQCHTQLSGETFNCPCHLSRFAADGRVERGPAKRNLLVLETSYNPATDELTIA